MMNSVDIFFGLSVVREPFYRRKMGCYRFLFLYFLDLGSRIFIWAPVFPPIGSR